MSQMTEAAQLSELSSLTKSRSDVRLESPRPKSDAARPSLFAIALMVGALGLSVADSLPGGLSGGGGFLLGLTGALVVFSGLGFLAALREQRAAETPRGGQEDGS